MEALNQIGYYQLENLVMQRVGFTLMDLTSDVNLVDFFQHMSPYYLNFLKNQIQKSNPTDYRSNSQFSGLSKESPIIFICDNGADSKAIADQLENESYINVFYLAGGAAGLKK